MTLSPPLRLVIGAGSALLIGSLFLSWAPDRSGWELLRTTDVFLLITAIVAFVVALTGGRIGLFRPDLSLIGAADLLSLVAIVLISSLAIFDFPDEASREAGLFLALAASATIAAGAGDYRVFRGASWFPRLGD